MTSRSTPSRTLRLLALAMAAALIAAACGGDSGDDAGGGGGGEDAKSICPVDALDDADGPVEITLWHTYVGLTNRTLDELTADYNGSQDKVKVNVENQGAAYEELLRKYRQGIPSGDLPNIGIMEDTTTQFLADSGTIIPGGVCAEADGYTEYEDFLPGVLDFYTVDEVLQPASFNVSTVLLYYNRDHFEAAGLDPDSPPKTLAEVTEYARAIKAAGIVDQPVVLNMQPWFTEFWLTGAGEGLVDNDNGRGDGDTTAGAFDNDATRQLYGEFKTMDDEGLLNPVPGTEGQFDHYFAIGLQTSSMTIETSTAVTTINAVLEGNLDPAELGLDTELPAIDVNVDAGPFPGLIGPGLGQLGGGSWYMTNAGTPEQQAASWDFIKFINQPENQALWHLEGSYLPVRQATVDSQEVQDFWANTRPGKWLETAYEGLEAVDPEWPGPLIGPYTETRTAVRESLDGLLFGGESVDTVISGADQEITDAITSYNEDNF
ncbi:MAG TPA: extracellular solute-binding protein [Acidimicrobiales bacterium]|nr:extracellular solute-binding protein [Acidimicrobiales bacterium]